MLNLQIAELTASESQYTQNIPLASIISTLFIFELSSIIPSYSTLNSISDTEYGLRVTKLGLINWLNSHFIIPTTSLSQVPFGPLRFNFRPNFTNFIQVESIGQILYSNNRVWLLLASIILLLSMIGPITLSMNKSVDLL